MLASLCRTPAVRSVAVHADCAVMVEPSPGVKLPDRRAGGGLARDGTRRQLVDPVRFGTLAETTVPAGRGCLQVPHVVAAPTVSRMLNGHAGVSGFVGPGPSKRQLLLVLEQLHQQDQGADTQHHSGRREIPLPGVRRLLRHGIGEGEQSPEPCPKNEPS